MPRPKLGEERRKEILAAFEDCVVEKGFERTTLTDVAKKAGRPRSLVRHFIGNREQMVVSLIDRILDRAERQAQSLPAAASIDQVMTLLLDRVFEDPTTNIVIMELWHVALRDEEVRSRLADVYGNFILRVATMISGGELSERNHERAFAAVSMSFGSAFYRYLGVAVPDPDALRARVRSIFDEA